MEDSYCTISKGPAAAHSYLIINNICECQLTLDWSYDAIYYKYYDPILIYIFLFLTKFNNFNEINLKKFSVNLVIFYVFFLILNLYKINLKNYMIS